MSDLPSAAHPAEEELQRLVDGDLDLRADALLMAHVEGCEACLEHVRRLRHVGAVLSHSSVPPEDLLRRIMDRRAGARPSTGEHPRGRSWRWTAEVAGLAAVLLLMLRVARGPAGGESDAIESRRTSAADSQELAHRPGQPDSGLPTATASPNILSTARWAAPGAATVEARQTSAGVILRLLSAGGRLDPDQAAALDSTAHALTRDAALHVTIQYVRTVPSAGATLAQVAADVEERLLSRGISRSRVRVVPSKPDGRGASGPGPGPGVIEVVVSGGSPGPSVP